jgi:hypothetical protein
MVGKQFSPFIEMVGKQFFNLSNCSGNPEKQFSPLMETVTPQPPPFI